MSDTIREAILAMLREMNYDLPEDPGPLALGSEGLDLESLAVAELAVRIEDEYGVQFGEEEAAGMGALTFDGFVALVADRVGSQTVQADQVG